ACTAHAYSCATPWRRTLRRCRHDDLPRARRTPPRFPLRRVIAGGLCPLAPASGPVSSLRHLPGDLPTRGYLDAATALYSLTAAPGATLGRDLARGAPRKVSAGRLHPHLRTTHKPEAPAKGLRCRFRL